MQLPVIAIILIISLTAISAFSVFRRNRQEQATHTRNYSNRRKARWLLYSGLMLLGVSMGIITGITIAAVFDWQEKISWLITGCIVLFNGICAIICHRIEKRER